MNFSRRSFVESLIASFALRPMPGWAVERPILKFGVLSDTHIISKPESTSVLRKEFARFAREGARAVIISGDLCEIGTLTELENVMVAWRESFPGGRNARGETIAPVFTFGNHDYHDDAFFKSKGLSDALRAEAILFNKDAAWQKITGRSFEGEIYRRDICGVTFLAAHWGHYDEELADWLKRNAAEIPSDKPVFFVQHSHPRQTCFGKWYKSSSRKNLETLLEHPNFFVISGHSHIANTYEDALWQGGFVSMAAGGASGSGGRRYEYNVGIPVRDLARRGTRHMPPQDSGHACLSSLVTVYPSRVTVNRWDHLFDEHVGEDWDIPFPFQHDRQHPFTLAERADAPEFPKGATVEVLAGEGLLYPLKKPEHQIHLTFPCAASVGPHSRVVDYRVEISRCDNGLSLIERLVAQSKGSLAEHHALAERGRCTFGKDELPIGVRLKAKITPLNAGGRGGKSLTKEFTI